MNEPAVPMSNRGELDVLCSGPIRLDPATRELRVDGETVAIERRAFDLLHYLMRHAERVVDKDELWREVWAARPVTDSTLPQAVSRVRKALGGEPEAYVATVYGVGYRFVGPVARESAVSAMPPSTAEPPHRHRSALLWALPLLLVGLLAWWQPWTGTPESVRVAVLPVRNDTGQPELDWVGFGGLSLIDQALASAGVERVSSSTVLATLGRYPEARGLPEQARILRLNTGAQRVLQARLSRQGEGYRLDLQPVEEANDTPPASLSGTDVAVLAVAAGQRLSQSLHRRDGITVGRRQLITDDPFVNEAYARGLDARLRDHFDDARRYFQTALAAAPALLPARYQLLLVVRRQGDWDEAQRQQDDLLQLAREQADQPMLAAAQSAAGTLAWRRGDKLAAARWYGQSLDGYRALGDEDNAISVIANLGILAATGADFATAEAHFRQAVTHYQTSGDRYNEAALWKNLGALYNDSGRHGEAEAALQRALQLRQTLELPLPVAWTLNALADVEMARGRWASALAYNERALATAEQFDDRLLLTQTSADLASVLRQLGRLQAARQQAARALATAVELGQRTNQAYALLQQGQIEAAAAQWPLAGELLQQAVSLYEQIDEPQGQARSLLALLQVHLGEQQWLAAEADLAALRALLAQADLTNLQPALLAATGELAGGRGDFTAAVAALDAARALVGESTIEAVNLDARLGHWLWRLDPHDPRLPPLADRLSGRADASAQALAFLQTYHTTQDPAKALGLAERRKQLQGEAWPSAAEADLQTLQRRLSGD
ncbi:MAG: tetratricopeptide repeat protein [Xanthomonadales bacterium]|nr:tetratricopeptide repeat protein [Xanthomonadales bacterium]